MSVQIIMEGQPPKFLTAPDYTLGRGSDCEVLLPEGDALVSRRHAKIERDTAGDWWIADLGSTNGTFVNGEKLSGRRRLISGDQVGIGRSQIGFVAPQSARSAASLGNGRATETVWVTAEEVQARLRPATAEAPRADHPTIPPLPPLVVTQPMVVSPAERLDESEAVDGAVSAGKMVIPGEEPAPVPAAINERSAEFAAGELANISTANPVKLVTPNVAHLPESPVGPMLEPERDLERNSAGISLSKPVVAESPSEVFVTQPPAEVLPPLSPPFAPEPLEPTPVSQVKRCSRCRKEYDVEIEGCPSCGAAGFSMRPAPVAPLPEPKQDGTVHDPFEKMVLPASPAPPGSVATPKNSPPLVSPTYAAPPDGGWSKPPPPRVPPQPDVSHVVHHVVPSKNPAVAILFSIFFPGLGQLYNGEVVKGLAVGFGYWTMVGISLIPFIGWLLWLPLIVCWIWNIIDASRGAEQANRQTAPKPPVS